MNNEEYVCTREKVGEIFEIECANTKEKNLDKKIIHCLIGTKEKSGGISAIGVGVEYGEQNPAITCFSDDDLKEKIAKKLKTTTEKIKFDLKD